MAGKVMLTESDRKIDALLLETSDDLIQRDEIIFRGNTPIIPIEYEGDLKGYIRYLIAYQEQQSEQHVFQRVFRYRPWDGAFAFQEALRKLGQAAFGRPTYDAFGGKHPPEMIDINVDIDRTVQVPWGQLNISLGRMKGTVYMGQTMDEEYGLLFSMSVETAKANKKRVDSLFRLIERQLETESIYRGKAVNGQTMPEFIDLRTVDRKKVVYSQHVQTELEAHVWSLLRYTDNMREQETSLKRANLLAGDYGTGKTLTAFITAQEAVANEWTFVYCRPGKDNLYEVMQTARLYQPAVVFFEDVDVLSEKESADRDTISKMLDVFDGITAKGTELMVIMTTNHLDKLHKGLMRPGRLDSIIDFGALDHPGVEALIKAHVPSEQLSDDIDFEKVGEAMEEYTPAFVVEAIDRTKRYSMARNNGKVDMLVTDDLVNAAEGLRAHYETMQKAQEVKKPDLLTEQVKGIVADVVDETDVLRGGEKWGELNPANHK